MGKLVFHGPSALKQANTVIHTHFMLTIVLASIVRGFSRSGFLAGPPCSYRFAGISSSNVSRNN